MTRPSFQVLLHRCCVQLIIFTIGILLCVVEWRKLGRLQNNKYLQNRDKIIYQCIDICFIIIYYTQVLRYIFQPFL
jgi:uncharacterized membrane protein YcjF (UPF0283 family)